MLRSAIVCGVLLIIAPVAVAQDMPLTMFLLDGESWKPSKSDIAMPVRPVIAPAVVPSPTASGLAPDGRTLYVGSSEGRYVWAFRVNAEGKAGLGDRYARLWAAKGQEHQPVTALTFDSRNCLYAATPGGLQAFDPTGRLCGVIAVPSKKKLTGLMWTGPDLDVLVAEFEKGEERFARKMNARGIK